jgi:hypothetical protein
VLLALYSTVGFAHGEGSKSMRGEKKEAVPEVKQGFKADWRKENPSLHLLYVKTAIRHLIILDQMIQRLSDESNLNLLDATVALGREREILVRENAAFADAHEVLRDLFGSKLIKLRRLRVFPPRDEPEEAK